jgi:hypothetical protein
MARTSTRTINLEKYIEFPAATTKVDGFSGINFHFDSQVIAKIHQAQQRGTRLQVSKQLQTQLRCCALLGLESYIQSGLSICTYYQRDDHEEPVIKSLLSPDGDMLHQVSSYYLSHQSCHQITSAHYWLLQQLTRHLAWQQTRIVDILAWSIAILCILGLFIAYPQGITANILAWGIVLLVTWGLQKLLKFIFKFQAGSLEQWAIDKFLSLSTSPQRGQQKMAKFFLQYFVV